MRAALCTALCVLGLAAPAYADRADQLFRKGKKLLAERRYPEACSAFEESDRLDPGIGAKLNVAKCYEEWGKLATAWRWYRDAEDMAFRNKDDRAPKIHAIVVKLEPIVPRLTLKLDPDANTDGVVVKLDGTELDAAALVAEHRVDPGPHQIDTIIAGVKRTTVVPLERGGSSEVTLQLPTRAKAAVVVVVAPGLRRRRLVGMATAGGGAAMLVVAGIVTLRARDDYRYALTTHCAGATDMCDEDGLRVTHGARTRAHVATGVTAVGLAAVGIGAYLYVTARRSAAGEHALYLAPRLERDGGSVVLGGAF